MKLLGIQLDENSTNVMSDFHGSKPAKVMELAGMSPEEKTNLAVDMLKRKVEREDAFIKKYQTEKWGEFKATFEDGAASDVFGTEVITGIQAELAALKERNATTAPPTLEEG